MKYLFIILTALLFLNTTQAFAEQPVCVNSLGDELTFKTSEGEFILSCH